MLLVISGLSASLVLMVLLSCALVLMGHMVNTDVATCIACICATQVGQEPLNREEVRALRADVVDAGARAALDRARAPKVRHPLLPAAAPLLLMLCAVCFTSVMRLLKGGCIVCAQCAGVYDCTAFTSCLAAPAHTRAWQLMMSDHATTYVNPKFCANQACNCMVHDMGHALFCCSLSIFPDRSTTVTHALRCLVHAAYQPGNTPQPRWRCGRLRPCGDAHAGHGRWRAPVTPQQCIPSEWVDSLLLCCKDLSCMLMTGPASMHYDGSTWEARCI